MVKAMLLLRIDKSRISGLKFKNDRQTDLARLGHGYSTAGASLAGKKYALGRFVTGKREHFGKKVSVL